MNVKDGMIGFSLSGEMILVICIDVDIS